MLSGIHNFLLSFGEGGDLMSPPLRKGGLGRISDSIAMSSLPRACPGSKGTVEGCEAICQSGRPVISNGCEKSFLFSHPEGQSPLAISFFIDDLGSFDGK